jgi:phosphopantetheinyl transferase (holo-ACP synthase)
LLKFYQFNNLPSYDIIAPPKTALPFFLHYLSLAKEYLEANKVKHIHLTISHVKKMASAFVVLEK